MSVGIIFLLLLALLLVIFTLQNTMLIDVQLLFWQVTDVPLVLALIITLILGFVVAILIYYPKIWRLKSKIKEQEKQISQLKATGTKPESNPEGVEMTGGSEKGFFSE